MLVIASVARYRGGHPLWHLLIVAGAAVAVFVGIKAKEYWDGRILPERQPLTIPTVALALFSVASGAIHASVSGDHFREAFIFGAFFLVASAAQVAWGVLFLYRQNTTALVGGAAGNAAIIALWTVTRTVGLPIGPEPWHAEPIGRLDVASTLCELALVLGAGFLLARLRTGLAAQKRLDPGDPEYSLDGVVGAGDGERLSSVTAELRGSEQRGHAGGIDEHQIGQVQDDTAGAVRIAYRVRDRLDLREVELAAQSQPYLVVVTRRGNREDPFAHR